MTYHWLLQKEHIGQPTLLNEECGEEDITARSHDVSQKGLYDRYATILGIGAGARERRK
jgi:hypothetical protein